MLASSLFLKLGRQPLGFCRASVNVQLPGWCQLLCLCFAPCTVAEISFAPVPPFPAAKYWQGFNIPLSIQNDRAWVVATHSVVMVTLARACGSPQTLQAPSPHSSIGDEFKGRLKVMPVGCSVKIISLLWRYFMCCTWSGCDSISCVVHEVC